MKKQKKLEEQSKQKMNNLSKKQLMQIAGGTKGDGDGEGSQPDPY